MPKRHQEHYEIAKPTIVSTFTQRRLKVTRNSYVGLAAVGTSSSASSVLDYWERSCSRGRLCRVALVWHFARPPVPGLDFEVDVRGAPIANFATARDAAQPLSDASIDPALAAIGRLETLPDARELTTAFG